MRKWKANPSHIARISFGFTSTSFLENCRSDFSIDPDIAGRLCETAGNLTAVK